MRWPWRRRNKGGRVIFIGTSPFDVAAAIAAVPTPSPVVSAWVPDAEPALVAELAGLAEVAEYVEQVDHREHVDHREQVDHREHVEVPAQAAAPEEPRVGVQLGFADGTVMTLDDDDPRAVALRAAAARLTGAG